MNEAIISSMVALVLYAFSVFQADKSFERDLQRWTENAKTNMTVETSVSFRDKVVMPFLRREMPNPFAKGGAESGKPWAKRAEKVFEVGLRDFCDGFRPLWYYNFRNCQKAGDLYNEGCREPFIVILSGFDPRLNVNRNEDIERVRGKGKKNPPPLKPGQDKVTLLDVIRTHALRRMGAMKHQDAKDYFKVWLHCRKFSAEDEVAIYRLRESLFGRADGLFEGIPELSWSCALDSVLNVNNEGVEAAGVGIAASITTQGWMTLNDKRRIAKEILEEAEKMRPGRVDTLEMKLYIDGNMRRGSRPYRHQLFQEITSKIIDDPESIAHYVWFNMYPRWGGDARRYQMLRFADACYETGRHDTAIPYFYAETMCRYVRDSAIDPYRFFRRNPEVTDKCIDVCMRQATNELACGYLRINAPFVGAAVAYYAGRYEKAAEFAPYIGELCSDLDNIFFCKESVARAVKAFGGMYSKQCIQMQRLFDSGRYADVLYQVHMVPRAKLQDRAASGFLGTLEFDARMQCDFPAGKDMSGTELDYWNVNGWWRSQDWAWRTKGQFEWENMLSWMAGLPRDHELEFVLSPSSNTEGRHVLVVSRLVYEEKNPLPLNGIPFVTLIWENGCTRVSVDNDYYKMFKIDPYSAVEKPAKGLHRRVRIVCEGGRLDVYVDGGDSPVVSTRQFATWIGKGPVIGYASFHGKDVAVSDVVARKVRRR
ncbi:MAG: hypothetical protein K6G91_05085 [Kiritimatiellae bacterium]|nr:hypothetical protein [Kiritimatiellia bacterium]